MLQAFIMNIIYSIVHACVFNKEANSESAHRYLYVNEKRKKTIRDKNQNNSKIECKVV